MRFRPPLLLTVAIALVAAACGGDADDETIAGDPTTTTTEARLGQECATDAYTVRYPADWRVADEPEDEPCTWFNPEPVALPEATEALDVAVHLDHPVEAPFDELAANLTDGPGVDQVLRRDEVTVAGHDAVVVETVASDEAPITPQGARAYTYAIADVGGAVMVASTTTVGEGDYEENKAVLDGMTSSLTTPGT